MFRQILNADNVQLHKIAERLDYALDDGYSTSDGKYDLITNFLIHEHYDDPEESYLTEDDLTIIYDSNFEKYLIDETPESIRDLLDKKGGKLWENYADNLINLILIEKEDSHFQKLDKMESKDKKVSSKAVSNDNSNFVIDTILLYPEEIAIAYSKIQSNYSLRNLCLLVTQMVRRELEIEDVKSFPGWRRLGYRVNKGEKALGIISLTQPQHNRGFMWTNSLFTASQTNAPSSPIMNYLELLEEDGYSLEKIIQSEVSYEHTQQFSSLSKKLQGDVITALMTILGEEVSMSSLQGLDKEEKKIVSLYVNYTLKWIKDSIQ